MQIFPYVDMRRCTCRRPPYSCLRSFFFKFSPSLTYRSIHRYYRYNTSTSPPTYLLQSCCLLLLSTISNNTNQAKVERFTKFKGCDGRRMRARSKTLPSRWGQNKLQIILLLSLALLVYLLGISMSNTSDSIKTDVKYANDLATKTSPISPTSSSDVVELPSAVLLGGRDEDKEALRDDAAAATRSFTLMTGNTEVQEAYDLAFSEVDQNIHPHNKHFIAGAGWTQLWTRDTSYAIELGAGLIHPDISLISLHACTEYVPNIGTVWLQDVCGHFGGWPNLTDAIVGARGAWSLYLLTGNKTLIQWAYNITKNSLLRAERDAFDTSTGLFTGCSSFMESNSGYPMEYKSNGKMVGKTKALSTNILHYDGYYLASKMGDEVGAPRRETRSLLRKAKRLQRAIRSRLWRDDLGYYSYMEDMNNQTVDQMEGLGESLALLSDDFETDQLRIDAIFRWTPRTTRGIPCLWPRFLIEERQMMIATYYHNGRIWPFVQSYWAIAAARHQKLTIFQDELNSLLKLSRTKNTFAEFYDLDGTFPSSRSRQLWSSSGFLGMVYFGLFGITFTPDGILFRPIKPWMGLSKTISLTNFHYRNIVLDIYVTGFGSNVESFLLDDVVQENPFITSTLKGHHIVKLTLD